MPQNKKNTETYNKVPARNRELQTDSNLQVKDAKKQIIITWLQLLIVTMPFGHQQL